MEEEAGIAPYALPPPHAADPDGRGAAGVGGLLLLGDARQDDYSWFDP